MLRSWFVSLIFLAGSSFATVVSPFNGKQLDTNDSCCYSFIVTGHLHGASTNTSGFPASSLLANLDTIVRSDASFMISLGDMFLKASDYEIGLFNQHLFSKLPFPLFNAVGNHDLSEEYKKRFGPTWFSFTRGTEAFFILDTELNDGSVKGLQLDSLKSFIRRSGRDSRIRSLFIFSHRPVWAEEDKVYQKLFTDNTQSFAGVNYQTEVLPLIGLAGGKNIYWMSGSMGGMAPASFFYDKKAKVHFIVTSIRDQQRDAILKVSVENGNVRFNTISLTGKVTGNLESYNVEYWNKNSKEPVNFNIRLLPYNMKQMLSHSYFWIGFAVSFLLALTVFLRRRRKHVV